MKRASTTKKWMDYYTGKDRAVAKYDAETDALAIGIGFILDRLDDLEERIESIEQEGDS